MQVAVAGMEDVDHAQAVLPGHLPHLGQHLDQPAARHGAVEAHIVGRDLADGGERRLAAGPEQHALLLVAAHTAGRGAALAWQSARPALTRWSTSTCGPSSSTINRRLGVHRIARADIGLGALHGVPVHHLHAAGDDARGDDGGDAFGGTRLGREAEQHGARRRGLAQQPHRHLGDDAEQPFGAGHQAHQVVAFGIEMLAAQPHDLAGHQHHLDAEKVVGGEAVFQAVHAAGILRDIAADRAGDLRAGIGRVVEALVLDGLGDAEVGDAGLHAGAAVGVVDLEHAVELAQPQQDGVAHRHRAARQRGAGAARHDLDLVVLAVAQDGRDLRPPSRAAPRPAASGGRPTARRTRRAACRRVSSITPSPGTMARKRGHDLGRGGREWRDRAAASACFAHTPNEKAAEAEASAASDSSATAPVLALAGLEARVGLVDDVDPALAAHDAAVLVARFTDLSE